MRIAWLVVSLASASGCGLGHLVRPDEGVQLGTSDGLLAIDVEVPNAVLTLTLCRDGDYANCLTTGPLSTDAALQLYQVPAGTYCLLLAQLDFLPAAGSIERPWAPETADCFAVHAGSIDDPGLLVFEARRQPDSGVWYQLHVTWQHRVDFEQRLLSAYPDFAGRPSAQTQAMPLSALQ